MFSHFQAQYLANIESLNRQCIEAFKYKNECFCSTEASILYMLKYVLIIITYELKIRINKLNPYTHNTYRIILINVLAMSIFQLLLAIRISPVDFACYREHYCA